MVSNDQFLSLQQQLLCRLGALNGADLPQSIYWCLPNNHELLVWNIKIKTNLTQKVLFMLSDDVFQLVHAKLDLVNESVSLHADVKEL